MMKTRLLTPQITAFLCQPDSHHPSGGGRRSLKLRQRRFRLAMECSAGGDGLNGKKKEEDEGAGTMEKEEESSRSWKEGDDVNEEKVELMEREAIMGKDDGREAMDYKRRAALFYKSSEVFMQEPIKDDHPHPHPHPHHH